jgi:hypothetical protein
MAHRKKWSENDDHRYERNRKPEETVEPVRGRRHRNWGKIDLDSRVTVDRNGLTNDQPPIPKQPRRL